MALRFRLIRVCKGESMSAIPQDVVRYDLKASADGLKGSGYEVDDKDIMLIARKDGIEVTVYVNGRLMLSPMQDKELATRISENIFANLVRDAEE